MAGDLRASAPVCAWRPGTAADLAGPQDRGGDLVPGPHQRTVRDYEHLPASHEAMITWAMIALMTRRLTLPGE